MGRKQKWCAQPLASVLQGRMCGFLLFPSSFWPECGQPWLGLPSWIGRENWVLTGGAADRENQVLVRWGHMPDLDYLCLCER